MEILQDTFSLIPVSLYFLSYELQDSAYHFLCTPLPGLLTLQDCLWKSFMFLKANTKLQQDISAINF